MGRFVFSISIVILGIGVGYMIQVLTKRKNLTLSIDTLKRKLQRSALLFFNPVAILGATWVANIHDIKIAALPFMGMTALFFGGGIAFLASRIMKFSRKQTGSYIVCGGFTNIGSLGALFCFMLLGEKGFALVPFYKLFEELIYYAIGFPIAKSYSDDLTQNLSFVQRLKTSATDIFVVMAVLSITIGLVLNASAIPRPDVYALVNSVFIPLAAFLLLISIGLSMQFSSVKTYLKPGLIIAMIKFALVPVMILGLGYLLGLNQIDNGLPLKVLLILSSMPVGFIAMVPPTIYHLDIDLANACWLITNAALLFEIPLLLFFLRFI
ncbi:MAG: hypothetical protein H8D87_03370 [Deltaproteobacteria bacterium]|uniref:AEC family transporter n=1 Tax=Desulfobacula sp. TaxID=2593537 RepID=UPI0019B61162|nr:hypothetical protein [Candidatus Desulfobacula maris]MBL6996103.1 hypothetical protein [Desulfobacula sp.]